MAALAAFVAAAALPAAAQGGGAARLGSYRIRKDRIFVAGFSSGGFMAVQMEVAYARLFSGAATYAAGPYYCAQGSPETALSSCMKASGSINLAALEKVTESWAANQLIDPLGYLRRHAVYLWSSRLDTIVRQPATDALEAYYRKFGVDVFRYDRDFNAAHGWESPYGPTSCAGFASPYVILCREDDRIGWRGSPAPGAYDSQQVWLSRFFGLLNPKNEARLSGSLAAFDQNEFAPRGSASGIGMAGRGFVFAPRSCAGRGPAGCGLLLVLHGCLQSSESVGLAFVRDAGLNQWADTNGVVVLYPQTIRTPVSNPLGCWDWWGYLKAPDYARKSGPQMRALYRMVLRAAAIREAGGGRE